MLPLMLNKNNTNSMQPRLLLGSIISCVCVCVYVDVGVGGAAAKSLAPFGHEQTDFWRVQSQRFMGWQPSFLQGGAPQTMVPDYDCCDRMTNMSSDLFAPI